MDVDPEIDPEIRLGKFYALGSAALGALSLCAGLVPACGTIASILGVVCGLLSLRIEQNKVAYAGIGLSLLGALITLTYFAILVWINP